MSQANICRVNTVNMKTPELYRQYNHDFFNKNYVEMGKTAQQISKEIARSTTFVFNQLKKYDIPKRIYQRAVKDLTNQVFGKLTVIRQDFTKPFNDRGATWVCKCDCGTVKVMRSKGLLSGDMQSCGCRTSFKEISGSYLYSIKSNAAKRGLVFNCSNEELWSIYLKQNKKCALSGVEIKFAPALKKGQQTASLDRIDSSKGYTFDNVQWVHKEINKMKSNLPEGEFLQIVKRIYEHKRM